MTKYLNQIQSLVWCSRYTLLCVIGAEVSLRDLMVVSKMETYVTWWSFQVCLTCVKSNLKAFCSWRQLWLTSDGTDCYSLTISTACVYLYWRITTRVGVQKLIFMRYINYKSKLNVVCNLKPEFPTNLEFAVSVFLFAEMCSWWSQIPCWKLGPCWWIEGRYQYLQGECKWWKLFPRYVFLRMCKWRSVVNKNIRYSSIYYWEAFTKQVLINFLEFRSHE